MALLDIVDLALDFATPQGPVRVLDGVDLSIQRGEILSLVGESGCGKSLTARAITRLLPEPPAQFVRGRIVLEDQDVLSLSREKLRALRGGRVGYVFQEPAASLNPVMRVDRQILESLRLHQPDHAHPAEVVDLLRRVGIPAPEERARAYPHELSGGMQQRIMLAMAIASRPALLVADEPTTALDVTIQAQILDLLRTLRQSAHTTILLITHNLGIVADIADRVAVMYAGQIVESGPVNLVLRQPRHPYTQALLDAVPKIPSSHHRLASIPGQVPAPGRFPTGCRFHPRCSIARPECAVRPPPWISRGEHGFRCPVTPEPVAS